MHEEILKSSRDALLVAIPLIALLFMRPFRLDQVIISREKGPRHHPPRRGVDNQGRRPLFWDPDGRPASRK